MSIYEMIMLVCFGAAWPFSIYKSYTSRQIAGKSVGFLYVVLIGYLAGIIHKLLYSMDLVIYLYLLNWVMVFIDLALYYRNKLYLKKTTGQTGSDKAFPLRDWDSD